MADRQENLSPQTSPRQEESQQPKPAFVRPPYLREDPWTSTTPPKDTSHWTRVRQLLNKHDGGTIGSWQEEINTQLIVSTLLSTLTGAFVIETQKSLSEDPIITAAVLLSHIAMQLNASIALPHSTLQPFSKPPPNGRAVNSLLYVSLGLSLSNVTLGLLCLQWLRELKADTLGGVSDHHYSLLHSARHNGFRKWGAKGLVSALPLLLLSSLTCFFAGLLCHVSTTDWVVSLPVGAVLGATFGVLVLTTLLPAVVIAGCAAFHRGVLAKSGGYPPIPPFYSLQSWLSLQLAVTILGSPIFKKLTTIRGSLRELKHCPDWGRVSLWWLPRILHADAIFLPLVHSSGNPSAMDDITLCLDDSQLFEGVSNFANPVQIKIRTLRYLIARYSNELPPHTLSDLENRLIVHLIHYFNDGGDFAAIGNLDFESRERLHVSSADTATQLFHATVQSYEHKLPAQIMSFWNFFWVAMRLGTFSLSRKMVMSYPMLIIRALNVVEEYGKRHSIAEMTIAYQYQNFVLTLSNVLSSHLVFIGTTYGRRSVASILFHPVWNELVSATRSLPPDEFPDWLREALDNLERLKDERTLHEYAPLSFDWTAQLYPDSEPFQPHIIVDIGPEARVEESPPSPVPIDIDDFGAGNPPPSLSVSTDGVKWDVEGDVGPGYGAALDIETMSTPNPGQAIRHDGSGHSASSSSSRPASAYVVMEADEDLDVHVEHDDARPTLHEAEERQETAEQEGGAVVDRHLAPLHLGDAD